jgi:glycosyltransferase involved in cell wall biosynthesis
VRAGRSTGVPMKVVIANFRAPIITTSDASEFWARHEPPPRRRSLSLFEQPAGWGFHIMAIGLYLRDQGFADAVEFWDYADRRGTSYLANGVLRVTFYHEDDVAAYMDRYGIPDLFVNYGEHGKPILDRLGGRCFRVHVPCLRRSREGNGNTGAECYLVDGEEYLDDRSMLYVPVVNTRAFRPGSAPKGRDFVYLAACYRGKRHDLVLDAVRGTGLTGHFHPVPAGCVDLEGAHVTTSDWDERDVVELLTSSRIAVYPGDATSNPAAMWECVAAGLPIVVNANIRGGRHLVVSGATGELAAPEDFRSVMVRVLADRERYRPREYFMAHWDPRTILERYLAFFRRMGWRPTSSGADIAPPASASAS